MTERARPVPPAVVVFVAGVLVVGVLAIPAWAGYGDEADRSARPWLTGSRLPVTQADDDRAVRLLRRAIAAPQRVSYTGTQYVSAWSALDRTASTSAVVEVEHTAGGPTVVNGKAAGRLSLPSGSGGATWLAGAGGPVGLLVDTHRVVAAERAAVAGRAAEVVEARRADGSVAARLWLDAEHALPLRREVYDEHGRALSASAFVEVDLVEAAPRAARTASRAHSAGGGGTDARATLSRADLERLRSAGWRCPGALDGSLVLYRASRHGDAVHLGYSDGVATLSVFEQPGYLDSDALDGFEAQDVAGGVVYARPGPPSQFTWVTEGDRVITVVADGPVSDVESVLDALPPDPADRPGGLLERIVRGAKRLVSWLNPFGG